ncbi:tRNA pseudouridine synthase D [Bienertia sinuspersici]
MCRTTEYYHHSNINDEFFIRLKSVSVCLSLNSISNTVCNLSESVTLVFLPRINGSFLEINASKYRPDSPAFVSLHRAVSQSDVVFASNEEICARDGVVFEVHLGENRLLHGVLRRRDDGVLTMDCKSVLSKNCGVKEAEICVTAENGVVLKEKVEVVVKKRNKRRLCRKFEVALQEIPEERESDVAAAEAEEEGSGGVCCCCCDEGDDDDLTVEMQLEMEKEIEGVKWAVDVGIWAVCLGVGFFVSRASARNLRRRRFLV